MGSWIEDTAHWRTVFAAAMELKHNPDPLFAELGQALHSYQVTHDPPPWPRRSSTSARA